MDNPPSSNHQDATSDSTASQSGANNGNLSIRVGQGGDTGTVTQGNQANAQASSSATGNVPQTGSDPSATAQSTTAQSSPKNANIDVRVGSPGDIAPVGQQNNAQAGASATGVNASDGQAGGRAAAHATQTSPDNINVIVRVGSPGDNGAVTQQNTVGASAGPNASITPVGGVATAGPAQTDQLTSATNTLTDVTNHGVVSQQLIQTQDGNGPNVVTVGDAGTTPAASSGVGYADATQRDAKNVNVSIRVGSPGTDGTVTQTNGATATGTTTGTANVSVTGAKNQNVSIVLPGTANAAPGTQWAWNWTWTGDGTPPTGATAATAAPTGGSTWNWAWTQQSTSAPAATAPTTTSTGWFTWTWTWKNADGQVWTLTQKQACDCNWTWTWNWDWSTGTPVSTGPIAASAADSTPSEPDPSITYDDGPVSQSNEVAATAQAAVDYTVTGEINVTKTGADPALESQDAEFGQSIANDQTALAVSQATQLNPWNVNSVWGVPVASVSQKNFTWADSFAGAQVTVNHELIQGQDGTEGTDQTYQWVGAQQTASNIQDVESGAQAAQSNSGNANLVSGGRANHAAVAAVEQSNSATASAQAVAAAWIDQELAQFQDAFGAGVEIISMFQQTSSNQSAFVAAVVAQLHTENINNLLVPAGSRATNPTVRQRNITGAQVSSTSIGDLTSVSFQYQGGVADIEVTDGLQQISLNQTAAAYAPAQEMNDRNYAEWRGVEPPMGGEETPPAPPAVATTPAPTAGVYRVFAPLMINPLKPKPHAPLLPSKKRLTPLQPLQPVFQIHLPAGGGSSRQGSFIPPVVPPTHTTTTTTTETTTGWSVPGALTPPAPSPASSTTEPAAGYPHATAAGAPALPTFPSLPPGNPDNPFTAGNGASGSAPSTGSGQTAIAFGPYKFAAQLVTGPQMPTSVLGRPAALLEPFEWPG